MENFDQIRVGNLVVVVRYLRAVTLELKKRGSAPRGHTERGVAERPPGERPAAIDAHEVHVVADIIALDTLSQTVPHPGRCHNSFASPFAAAPAPPFGGSCEGRHCPILRVREKPTGLQTEGAKTLATATAAMDEIVTQRSGSILRVELNRPARKNALTSSMYTTLATIFDDTAMPTPGELACLHQTNVRSGVLSAVRAGHSEFQ